MCGAGHSAIVFVNRPTPVTSTSTTSPMFHRPRVGRRAGEDDVARQQRDVATQVGEDVVDGERHVADRILLDDLAIDVGAQRLLADVDAADAARGPTGQ